MRRHSAFATAARIAGDQHGRVCRHDLLEAGIDAKRIDRWVADGRLRPVHRGVYAVGHLAVSVHASYMAATLAGGDGAVLSHLAAAHLMRLVSGPARPPEITVPTTAQRRRPGIVVHRVRVLDRQDVSTYDDIAITTVPRTLLDIAPRLEPALLSRACHQAWVVHDTPPRWIERCVARNRTKHGAAKLLRALGSDVTLSTLEDAFVALLRTHGMPAPRTNIDHQGDKVDCHWPQHGLTVELLSYRFHASRAAFEADVARRRRSDHIAFTYGDVFERPAQTLAELQAAMRAAD